AYLGILGLLSLYGCHRLYIAVVYWGLRKNSPQPGEDRSLPVVTVQLPVFNERNVIERLIDAAAALDWPAEQLEIQVLDDSTDDTTEVAQATAARWQAKDIDVKVIRREDRVGFKAGALQAGMKLARGDYLAVFDADFVPPPEFLRVTMPHLLRSERTGMVQARWGHLNEKHSLLTRLSAVLLDGHFVLEHTARNRSGKFFNFNGTAGIWKRACIEDAGGWQHDTLTEDLDLSYRAQLAGWEFVFLRDLVSPAELPADMRAFKIQQHRWAKGTVQTARKLAGPILRSNQPARVKAEALVHLSSNFAYPLVLLLALLMPLAVLARGRSGVTEALLLDLPAFVLATLSVGIFYAMAEREADPAGWRAGLWRIPLVMSLGIGMAVNQTRAVIEGLLGSDVTFVRTPKAGTSALRRYRQKLDWTPIVELAFAAYFVVGIVWIVEQHYWASLPFMALFGAGFGYVGLMSLREA
ncbi:MAG: cellulose synthase/poly-beta-1,6-N-acetylglucosamine synthase-like glycosyltransferase, partial [Myxococcota bacterium]